MNPPTTPGGPPAPSRLPAPLPATAALWLAGVLAAASWGLTGQGLILGAAALGLLLGLAWAALAVRAARAPTPRRPPTFFVPAAAAAGLAALLWAEPDLPKAVPVLNRLDWAKVVGNTAARPALRYTRHHRRYAEAARAAGPVDVLWLGDSITEHWGREGRAVWAREFGGLRCLNFGVGGDRTQNVLWRAGHGELDGVRPRVVVVEAGTNNLNRNTPAEVAEGVRAVVEAVRGRLPGAKVIVNGVFPRGETLDDPVNRKVAEVNARLARLDDGDRVRVVVVRDRFADARGGLGATIPGGVHLSEAGYQVWADALRPVLRGAFAPGPAS